VLDRYLPQLSDLIDLSPLAGAGVVLIGPFVLAVLLLIPFALARGEVGNNARLLLRQLFALLHALIDAFKRGSRR
jgi:hypothetical protein